MRNHEAERKVAAIRVRAERRCGQLLREMAAKGKRSGRGDRKSNVGTPELKGQLPSRGVIEVKPPKHDARGRAETRDASLGRQRARVLGVGSNSTKSGSGARRALR